MTQERKRSQPYDSDGDEEMSVPSGDPGAGAGSGAAAAAAKKRKVPTAKDNERNVRRRLLLDASGGGDSKEFTVAEAAMVAAGEDVDAVHDIERLIGRLPSVALPKKARSWLDRQKIAAYRHRDSQATQAALAYMAMYGVEPLESRKRILVRVDGHLLSNGEEKIDFINGRVPQPFGITGAWLSAGNVELATSLPAGSTDRDRLADEYGAPPWNLVIFRVDAYDLFKAHKEMDKPERKIAPVVDKAWVEKAIEADGLVEDSIEKKNLLLDFYSLLPRLEAIANGAVYRSRTALLLLGNPFFSLGPAMEPAIEWVRSMGADVITMPLHKYLLQRFVIQGQLVRSGVEDSAASSAGRGKLLDFSGPLTDLISEYAGTSGRCRICEAKTRGNAKYCSSQCRSTADRRSVRY